MPRRSRSPERSRRRRRSRSRSSSSGRRRHKKREGGRNRDEGRKRDKSRERKPRKSRSRSASKKRDRSLSWSPPPALRRQMLAAKEEAEARAKGAPVQVFDGYRFVEVSTENESTLAKRRLMIQNLPPQITDEGLTAFLNAMLRECGAIGAEEDAIINCWVSKVSQVDKKGITHEKAFKFAFVQMASVESAATTIALNGINCMGNNIKIMFRSIEPIIGTCAGGVILPQMTAEELLEGGGTMLPSQTHNTTQQPIQYYGGAGPGGAVLGGGMISTPMIQPQQQQYQQQQQPGMYMPQQQLQQQPPPYL